MSNNIKKHINLTRITGLPETMCISLKEARLARGWSQLELGRRIGLPQMHISGIETGKITPRFNTLIDLVRVLDYDLLLVPRSFIPAVQSLIRDNGEVEERSIYATDGEQDGQEPPHHEV